VLLKHGDGRDIHCIADYYKSLIFILLMREETKQTIARKGWQSGDYSQKMYQNW